MKAVSFFHTYIFTFGAVFFHDVKTKNKIDPIDRAIGVYHRLQATSDHPDIKDMTLLEYAHSSYAEENWMVCC